MQRSSAPAFLAMLGMLALGGCSPSHAETPAAKKAPEGQVDLRAESQQKIGLKTETVVMRAIASKLLAPAKMAVIPENEAHVTVSVTGRVRRVFKRLGDHVRRGEPLAILDSTDLGAAESDFLQAEAKARLTKANLDRERALFDRQYAAKKDLLQAENDATAAGIDYERATNQLLLHGATQADIRTLLRTRRMDNQLSVVAPIDAVVTGKALTLGEQIPAGNTVFTLDAMDSLWAIADVHEKDLAKVQAGDRVVLSALAYPGRTFQGRVESVGEGLDKDTHTAKVRIRVPNRAGLLRPEMYVDARIASDHAESLPSVPASAVILQGQQRILYVARGGSHFERRIVSVGSESDGWIGISQGIKPGERVVSSGALLLDAASKED